MSATNKDSDLDFELLNSQKSYKLPIHYYFLKTKWWQFLLKILFAYVFSLLLDNIESMRNYSFWASFIVLELILYNYLSNEEYRP